MALARVKVWIPGDVLTAADLNGEFNNFINNPISLFSPTTGTINFALLAHTNLLPSVLTGTSGSSGEILTLSTSLTPVWAAAAGAAGNPTIQLSPGAASFSSALFPQLLRSTEINNPELVLGYDASTGESAYWSAWLSTNVTSVSTASLDLAYVSTSSGGTTVWECQTRFILSGSSGGGASTSVSSTQTYGNVGTINRLSLGLTASSWAPPGLLQVKIRRLSSDAGDASATDAYLISAAIKVTV